MRTGQYQWDSRDYAAHSEAQQEWALELLEKLALRGDEKVLDIGCGDGKVTAVLAKRLQHGRVVGIDSSDEMIALARRNHGSKSTNLSFLLQDARSLEFQGEFDAIFSNAALHWIVDHRPVIRGMYRALKPGGRVLVQMGGKGNAAAVLQAINRIIARKKWASRFTDFAFPYGFHDADEYADWLAEAGFIVRNIGLIPKDMIHPDREKFTGWLRTTWLPWLQRVPEQDRNDFLRDVVDAYLGKGHRGQVETKMVRLEYLAKRPK